MPALNFQVQWADAVEYGAMLAQGQPVDPGYLRDNRGLLPKRTTIRRPGRAKPGDTLYLYTGQRTKDCRKLGEVLCLAVTPVRIGRERLTQGAYVDLGAREAGKELLSGPALKRFARLDTAGLWGTAELFAFFEHAYGLPFEGELICW